MCGSGRIRDRISSRALVLLYTSGPRTNMNMQVTLLLMMASAATWAMPVQHHPKVARVNGAILQVPAGHQLAYETVYREQLALPQAQISTTVNPDGSFPYTAYSSSAPGQSISFRRGSAGGAPVRAHQPIRLVAATGAPTYAVQRVLAPGGQHIKGLRIKAQQLQNVKEVQEQEEEDVDPNPQYNFSFDVKDDEYTNYQNRQENRDGDIIKGSYSVVDSDGYVRTVTYTADPVNGFQAKVVREPTDIQVKIPVPQPQVEARPVKVVRPAVRVAQVPLAAYAQHQQDGSHAGAYTLVPVSPKRLALRNHPHQSQGGYFVPREHQ